jgi:phosphoglycolate phosphatase-like HAD superfamily hydrolase
VWDVEASGRAGVPCIAVLSGGVSRCELEDAGAAAVFDNADDLCEQLDDTAVASLH